MHVGICINHPPASNLSRSLALIYRPAPWTFQPTPADTCGLHLMSLWWRSNIWAFLKQWLQSGFSALMALRCCQQWHHQALDPLLLCSIDLMHFLGPLVLFFHICCHHWLETPVCGFYSSWLPFEWTCGSLSHRQHCRIFYSSVRSR